MGQYFKDNSQSLGMMLNIAGGVYSASGQIAQGAAEQQYYDYLARSEEQQIKQQTINIQHAASREIAATQQRGKEFMSSQKTALAASGLGGGEELISDTAYKVKLDELAILENANIQIAGLDNQAQALRQTGRNVKTAANTRAFSSLLGTASQVADYWAKWKKTSKGGKKNANT